MANVNHSALTDPYLHEPKGASSASLNEVYVSDGAGSGSWKKIYLNGIEDYGDTGTSQALTSGTWVDLTNDGLGANTLTTYRLPGYNAIWDTTLNQFDWSGAGLSLGDTVDIRFDISTTTNTNNDQVAVRLDMAHGHASEYSLGVFRETVKTAGTVNQTFHYSVYMGNSETLNNPAKVAMLSDSAGNSVVVNGWFIRITPINPVFL